MSSSSSDSPTMIRMNPKLTLFLKWKSCRIGNEHGEARQATDEELEEERLCRRASCRSRMNSKIRGREEGERGVRGKAKKSLGKHRINQSCCRNCAVELLQNISNCFCCQEFGGCVEAVSSDLVIQDLEPDARLGCITDHPGFSPICFQKWSLKLAADKYKTKGKQKYRQTGSEERFFRGVSYREFSRLVYRILGNRRIPLPACAYVAIRK